MTGNHPLSILVKDSIKFQSQDRSFEIVFLQASTWNRENYEVGRYILIVFLKHQISEINPLEFRTSFC